MRHVNFADQSTYDAAPGPKPQGNRPPSQPPRNGGNDNGPKQGNASWQNVCRKGNDCPGASDGSCTKIHMQMKDAEKLCGSAKKRARKGKKDE